MRVLDLAQTPLREVNAALQAQAAGTNETAWEVLNPRGQHAIAVGLNAPVAVTVKGPTGYYCAGMNRQASVRIEGAAGPGVAENMMSGRVEVTGNAGPYAGATGRGGLLVVRGDASSRCGISMKGIDVVVQGSVGHMSGFLAQAGRMVICGDAGDALGDSIYEARLYVRGTVKSLGADCVEKEMRAEHAAELAALLADAGVEARAEEFRRYGSARQLYHFDIDNAGAY